MPHCLGRSVPRLVNRRDRDAEGLVRLQVTLRHQASDFAGNPTDGGVGTSFSQALGLHRKPAAARDSQGTVPGWSELRLTAGLAAPIQI